MKPWLKWAIVGLVLALLATGVFRALSARKAQQQALLEQTASRAQTEVELLPGDLVRAKTRELEQALAISGSLKAINSAFVKARVAGELQDFVVREGDTVQAGQVIARIDPREYRSRVQQAQQQADAAKTQIDIARRQYQNNKSLVDQGFISATALEASASNLAAAQANHLATVAGLEVAQKSLDDTVLRTPLAGQVAQRLAQDGERVGIDTRILEIVDTNRLELEATLSASESNIIRVGQSSLLHIEGSSKSISAKVARINPNAQTNSRAILAYLNIEQTQGLRPGLFAQGNLFIGRSSGLSIPLASVRTDKPAPYVQLIENNKVVHQAVEIVVRGQAEGETFVIVKGLVENASVLGPQAGFLRPGTAIKLSATTNK
ncbi:MAG: efflux RND transporter periplasmic adaptor subunit [Burkholderiaceae bacterium]